MKLASTMIERTWIIRGRAACRKPSVSSAAEPVIRDHTFFLDDNGLNIVEPAGEQTWKVVKLASWKGRHAEQPDASRARTN